VHPAFDVELAFGPMDFIQVNGAVNRRLVERAVALLDPRPGERVLDLFCGLGNFSLPLARSGAEVHGLEGDAGLVARAAANAGRNGLAAHFAEADLYRAGEGGRLPSGPWDRILLDPPRSGAGAVLGDVGRSGARRIVYVSCNPETLASDCARLVQEFGFRLEGAGIVDMFPHTTHVESIAVLERAGDA
jgi:23S rRNA (uracil1939-C5)-methyltransferase